MGALRAIATVLAFGLVSGIPSVAIGQDTESSIYSAAKDCSGPRSYLRSYPNGRFRADAQARIAKECATPKPVTRTVTPPPAPVDPCIRARSDWLQISGSSDLSVLRAYLNQTSYECQAQRAQASTRISEIETAQRQAAEWQQAEANRIAAEQAAAAQKQALLDRSWSAFAVSDWGDFWGTGYVDWGGVTGLSSPAAASAAAIKACDTKGDGKNCELISDPYNQGCLAFAYKGSGLTEGKWGFGLRDSESVARDEALYQCELDECKVEMVICAKPG